MLILFVMPMAAGRVRYVIIKNPEFVTSLRSPSLVTKAGIYNFLLASLSNTHHYQLTTVHLLPLVAFLSIKSCFRDTIISPPSVCFLLSLSCPSSLVSETQLIHHRPSASSCRFLVHQVLFQRHNYFTTVRLLPLVAFLSIKSSFRDTIISPPSICFLLSLSCPSSLVSETQLFHHRPSASSCRFLVHQVLFQRHN